MTDESLMLSVKNDNLDDLSVLYERYKLRLFRFFYLKNNHDEQESEDCVQQVFYRIIKYRKSFREDHVFLAWMFAIARNVRSQEFKDKMKRDNLISTIKTEEFYILGNDEHQALRQAMDLLPDAYKDVLIMSKFMGLKYDEIAKINNCSEGVIKTRVFRAMKYLKENYEKIV